MSIALITGSANAGGAQLVMEAVRSHLARMEEPLLVVPMRADAEHYLRELTSKAAAMGDRVEGLGGLIDEVRELLDEALASVRGAAAEAARGALEPRPQTCAFHGGCMYPTICRCER